MFSVAEPFHTDQTCYYHHGSGYTYYLRIVRVAYTRTTGNQPPPYEACSVPNITHKTFVPIQLNGSGSNSDFQNIHEVFRTVNSWKQRTGNYIIEYNYKLDLFKFSCVSENLLRGAVLNDRGCKVF